MPPTQTQTGKAFEYALICESNNILSAIFQVNVVEDESFISARNCFTIFTQKQQDSYSQAAHAAVNHIISLEPRLVRPQSPADILTLRLQPDAAGKAGDVRDLLFVRSTQNWEIGISAKNNHRALKHPRLSNVLDFGASWVGIPCSDNYFNTINPIFEFIQSYKITGAFWRDIPNKAASIYIPLLESFRNELMNINNANPNVPHNLTSYLIGRNDFYKVIKRAKVVEILGFNLNGTLGKRAGPHAPITPVRQLALPTEIVQFQMAAGRNDTLSMICNNGWQFTFRIHNAESLVTSSLKFDINLVGNPHNLHSHQISY